MAQKKVKLTEKQKIFIREYIGSLNASEAARKAGYSPKTARITANKMLTKGYIKDAIQEKLEEYNNNLDISNERILKEYARCAFYNIADFFNDDGSMKPLSELSEDASAALAGLDVHIGEDASKILKLKLPDKVKHLEALSKYQGLFEADNKQKGTVVIEVDDYEEDSE